MTQEQPPVVAAVIVHNGRVLLVRRRISDGGLAWQFPGGEQEAGETPFTAAVREASEEVGLKVTAHIVIGERAHPVSGRHMIYVGCEAGPDAARLTDTEELAELAWCTQAQLHEKIPAGVFERVARYLYDLAD